MLKCTALQRCIWESLGSNGCMRPIILTFFVIFLSSREKPYVKLRQSNVLSNFSLINYSVIISNIRRYSVFLLRMSCAWQLSPNIPAGAGVSYNKAEKLGPAIKKKFLQYLGRLHCLKIHQQ